MKTFKNSKIDSYTAFVQFTLNSFILTIIYQTTTLYLRDKVLAGSFFQTFFKHRNVWLVCCFLTASHIFCPQLVVAANKPTIYNETLQLMFDLSNGTVQHWYLPNVLTSTGAMHDLATPAGRLFILRGTIAGHSMEEWESIVGGWQVETQNRTNLTMRLAHPNGHFVIEKHWQLAKEPWRATLELTVNVQGTDGLHAADKLWLALGPGIGEVPAQGLGAGQNLYSFTKIVFQDSSGVHHLRTDENNTATTSNWYGLHSRYFALILSPANDLTRKLSWHATQPATPRWYPDHPSFETCLTVEIPLATGDAEIATIYKWNIFGGGKSYDALNAGEPNTGSLLFSGMWNWMRLLTLGIMHLLNSIYTVIGNWGLSIILLAVLVRMLLHPLARNAMLAQQRFTELQAKIEPELRIIKEKYRGGEQSEQILQLYKRHQMNPFSGLKPLFIVLLQLPIFVALFNLLGQTFEISSAPFLWIKTLAEPDKLFQLGVNLPIFGSYFNLLPVIMALTTLLSINVSPSPAATHKSSQRKNLLFLGMGITFFLLFYSFPSGMVLYWVTANLLQVAHQKIMSRSA